MSTVKIDLSGTYKPKLEDMKVGEPFLSGGDSVNVRIGDNEFFCYNTFTTHPAKWYEWAEITPVDLYIRISNAQTNNDRVPWDDLKNELQTVQKLEKRVNQHKTKASRLRAQLRAAGIEPKY